METPNVATLELHDLKVRYGAIEAVRDVSLHVDAGEIVTLIGGNGAGKTTTLKTISGVLRSVGGTITFEDERIDRLNLMRSSREACAKRLKGGTYSLG